MRMITVTGRRNFTVTTIRLQEAQLSQTNGAVFGDTSCANASYTNPLNANEYVHKMSR